MRSIDYQIWFITENGALVEYAEGAIEGTWTKRTAMREFKAKYSRERNSLWNGLLNGRRVRYAVVEVRSRVVAK